MDRGNGIVLVQVTSAIPVLTCTRWKHSSLIPSYCSLGLKPLCIISNRRSLHPGPNDSGVIFSQNRLFC